MTVAKLLVYLPVLPEVVLLVGACALMLVDLASKSQTRMPSYLFAQAVLVLALLATLLNIGVYSHLRFTLFYGHYFADLLSYVLKLFAIVSAFVTLVYARPYLLDRGLLRGEFLTLLLFSLLGITVMVSAASFLSMYVGLELLSLCLYAMVALNRDSEASTEAAMKYFVLGALASGLLLYGMSMIYGVTGTLDISKVAQALNTGQPNKVVLTFGLVFLVSGMAFKLGVVPFHMWIPDVYHGAPTAMTLIIGSAPKLAAFAMAMRLLVMGLIDIAVDWQQMLVILAVLSMAVGNLAAIAQTNIKRMLAYSTISHMGFMLLGLLAGVVNGNWLNAPDAYSAAMFYVVTYVLTTLGTFGMVMLLSRAGFEAEELDDFKGLNARSPWFAFVMLLLMFSLAGVPPTVGFYAKLVVLQPLLAADMTWLAVVAVMFSLIGAFYYLRVVKLMYFDEPRDTAPIAPSLDMSVLISLNGLAVLVLGIVPQSLMALCYFSIKAL